MRSLPLILASAFAVAGFACSNLERSRDLANPEVRPEVTAVQVCSICHGIDGNSVSPNFPRLAGQRPAYLIYKLDTFRSHDRSDPEGFEYMWGITRRLSDDQIKGLAAYFAKQSPQPIVACVNAQQMAAGGAIYEDGVPAKEIPACKACHGLNAEGVDNFPRLAWQHQNYLVKQLRLVRETDGRPFNSMKLIAQRLNNREMEEVATYLQGFPDDK